MSCVTWHLPPPPLGPGAGPTGCLCGCLCTFEKAAWWRKSCDVCLHAWLQCVAPPPLPHSPTPPPPFLFVAATAATPRGKWTKATRQRVKHPSSGGFGW